MFTNISYPIWDSNPKLQHGHPKNILAQDGATVAKQTVYKINRKFSFIQLSCKNCFIVWSLEPMQFTRLSLLHSWLPSLHHFTLLYPNKYGHIRIQVRMKRMSGMDIQYTNLLASSLGIEIHVNH